VPMLVQEGLHWQPARRGKSPTIKPASYAPGESLFTPS
jgi:hypothetical protein